MLFWFLKGLRRRPAEVLACDRRTGRPLRLDPKIIYYRQPKSHQGALVVSLGIYLAMVSYLFDSTISAVLSRTR